MDTPVPAEPPGRLTIAIEVVTTRLSRRRCTSCRRRRVLFALTAYGQDQPVGYGRALCAACAGFRR